MKVENISDVKVIINVLKPQPVVGLGNPAIFVEGTTKGHKVYHSISALSEDFDSTTDTYKKASAVLAQRNAPGSVHVITFEDGKIVEAAEDYFFEEWHFAILATHDAADALALSNMIEEQEYKFFVTQAATVAGLTPFADNESTIGLVHPIEEYFDAAIVGAVGSLQPGSVTWKFRGDLVGITAQKLSVSQLEAVHNVNGIAYVVKAGIPQTSEGTTLSGEYIDAIHGTHWVKASLETQLQYTLSTTDKLSFDASGIDLLNAVASNVLETATAQGIVAVDTEGKGLYTVTTLQREDLDPADIAARNYKGLSFNYQRSGAIHSVVVNGTIEV